MLQSRTPELAKVVPNLINEIGPARFPHNSCGHTIWQPFKTVITSGNRLTPRRWPAVPIPSA